MTSSLSTYTLFRSSQPLRGRFLFPGRRTLPEGTVGFVRSKAAARQSAAVLAGLRSPDDPLPWRDYPPEVLSDTSNILPSPFDRDHLLVGCRNILNEFGYQARLDGVWWRRTGDPPISPDWPVLAVEAGQLKIALWSEFKASQADVVTGIPLVIEGKASTRPFLVAHCSDVAHSYEVHPRGLIGPTSAAWSELSEAWQAAHDRGLGNQSLARSLARIASRHGCKPSTNLLHSIVASTDSGATCLFAITGALDAIARQLVRRWRVRNALVLDNGGSVGWMYCGQGEVTGILLVSSPNWRARGTVFLDLTPCDFVQPLAHGLVTQSVGRE